MISMTSDYVLSGFLLIAVQPCLLHIILGEWNIDKFTERLKFY